MFLGRSLSVVVGFILAASAVAIGKQPQSPTSEDGVRSEHMREGKRARHGRMKRHGFGGLGLLRELNLTEAQREQQRAIMERHLASIKSQREELFKLREKREAGTFSADDEARAKALRDEIHVSRQAIQTEIENTLTADQRAKLEQLKTERKSQHEGMIKRRRERREDVPQ